MSNLLVSVLVFLFFLSVSRCQGKVCEDKEKKECTGWKAKGYCKESSKWYGYLKENCKKTCGFCPKEKCVDYEKSCPYWASRGECIQNLVWMTINCRKSCEMCQPDQDFEECIDVNPDCEKLAARNMSCTTNKERIKWYMQKYCRKSCGICKEKCKDDNKECANWAARNECEKNQVWMKKNCRKSCGVCKSVECKDSYDSNKCKGWAAKGECEKNPKWMKKNCESSCKVCNDSARGSASSIDTKSNTTTTKDTESTIINPVLCGLRLKLGVVGGKDAISGEWPWQIAMALKSTPKELMCGGALINKQWVVTASHCFGSAYSNRIKPSDIVIRIGDHNLKKDEGKEIVSNVTKIVRHEGYVRGSYDNDIALIKLEKPVKYGRIKPICLPESKKEEKVNQKCYVTGWGRLAEAGKLADVLQEAQVPIVKRETCKATLDKIAPFTPNMICAGYKEGGVDACEGDSGGPFVCSNGGRYELVGVVSWGQGCARQNRYGVYTKVSNYIDWIRNTLKNN